MYVPRYLGKLKMLRRVKCVPLHNSFTVRTVLHAIEKCIEQGSTGFDIVPSPTALLSSAVTKIFTPVVLADLWSSDALQSSILWRWVVQPVRLNPILDLTHVRKFFQESGSFDDLLPDACQLAE